MRCSTWAGLSPPLKAPVTVSVLVASSSTESALTNASATVVESSASAFAAVPNLMDTRSPGWMSGVTLRWCRRPSSSHRGG